MAVEYLRAVADGLPGPVVAQHARRLADAVLAVPEVALARRVQAAAVSGSPLLVSLATQLAEALTEPAVMDVAGTG